MSQPNVTARRVISRETLGYAPRPVDLLWLELEACERQVENHVKGKPVRARNVYVTYEAIVGVEYDQDPLPLEAA